MSDVRKITTAWTVYLVVASAAWAVSAQGPASTNGMTRIQGGTFEMGIGSSDVPKLQEKFGIKRAELFAEEIPRHSVTLKPFYMDRTEVTNQAFKRFVEKNPEWQKHRVDAALQNGRYLQNWTNNRFPAGREKHPTVYVTWYAATAFCRSLGKRLPTEAEWEFAARGGLVGKEFPWGDEMPDKSRANSLGSGINAPTKVGSYPPNGYGLYDMAGNVWEFLSDEWSKYSSAAVAVDASTADDFLKITTRRALRGGSFGGAPVNLRVTYRDSHSPENAVEHVGFRCAASAK